MHRTNIYLTEELRGAVARRASRLGVSNSEVIRSTLERALLADRVGGLDDARAALSSLAPALHRRLRHDFEGDPDLRVD